MPAMDAMPFDIVSLFVLILLILLILYNSHTKRYKLQIGSIYEGMWCQLRLFHICSLVHLVWTKFTLAFSKPTNNIK